MHYVEALIYSFYCTFRIVDLLTRLKRQCEVAIRRCSPITRHCTGDIILGRRPEAELLHHLPSTSSSSHPQLSRHLGDMLLLEYSKIWCLKYNIKASLICLICIYTHLASHGVRPLLSCQQKSRASMQSSELVDLSLVVASLNGYIFEKLIHYLIIGKPKLVVTNS